METIHLVGSEGFIGKAIQKRVPADRLKCWSHRNSNHDNYINLLDNKSWANIILDKPQTVILLSWPGLPNYNENFHVTRNLPMIIEFVEELLKAGCKYLLITGTCYEYGHQNGKLHENINCEPCNQYAIAKDTLRRIVKIMSSKYEARLVWLRLFYVFGANQNRSSLYPSFVEAVKRGDKIFKIGETTQIRDFIHVDDVSDLIYRMAQNKNISGTFNCGSGTPQSVLELVEYLKEELNSTIKISQSLKFDKTSEPPAFWADMSKTNQHLMHFENHA